MRWPSDRMRRRIGTLEGASVKVWTFHWVIGSIVIISLIYISSS